MPQPSALGRMSRNDSKDTAFSTDLETKENLSELHQPLLDAGSQQSIIPWRKPWPRVEIDDIIDLTSPALLKQSRDGLHYFEHLPDDSTCFPPEAPAVPPPGKYSAIITSGVHDGVWSFSPKPSSFIILVPTKKRELY